MKILYINNNYEPDESYMENNLPKVYQELGHKVWIIANKTETNKHVKDKNIFLIKNKLDFLNKALSYHGIKKEVDIFKKVKPNIVIIDGEIDNLSLFSALSYKKKFPKTLFAVCSHLVYEEDFSYISSFKKIQIRLFKIIYSKIQKNIDFFLSLSIPNKKYLKEMLGVKKPIYFLPIGFNEKEIFFNEKHRNNIRRKLKLKLKDILIISSGKFAKHKKILETLKAFHKLCKIKDNVYFLLIGKDAKENKEYENELKDYVKENKLFKKVFLKGFLPHKELLKYFSASDLGVWPTSSSVSMVELMACKTTVLFQNDMAYQHVYNDTTLEKYLLKDSKISEIYHKMKLFCESNYKKLNQESLKSVKKYTWENIAKNSIKVFKKGKNKLDKEK